MDKKNNRTKSKLLVLYELARIFDNAADMGRALDAAMAFMAQYADMVRGMVALVSPHTGEIRIESAYGLTSKEISRGRYSLGEGITGSVIQTGSPIIIPNVKESPLFLNRTHARDLLSETTAFICVPIKFRNEVLGSLAMDCRFETMGELEKKKQFMAVIACMMSRSAKARQDSMDDPGKEGGLRIKNTQRAYRPRGFVGNSHAMQFVYEQICQVAPSSATVLLTGESGTGKELVARAIHEAGRKASQPFISINCAALPESLIESELFGHERGAFTGASSARKGRFELADNGTLFLDEVGEMPLAVQAKLLRVLQERTFERVGGMESRHVDVRIIAATNRDLPEMVGEGKFRHDLYYRLNVFPIHLPPLRERANDILPLASYFVDKYAALNGRGKARLALMSMDMLQRYAWPGNIRELENVIERAILLIEHDGIILPRHLPPELHSQDCPVGKDRANAPFPCRQFQGTLQERLEEMEKASIQEALEFYAGHMGNAAKALGLTERVMALRMKKYGFAYKDYRR